jgi:hypothetical protein
MSDSGDKHWLACAEEARTQAESLKYPGIRDVLLRLAAHYDRMAIVARQQRSGTSNGRLVLVNWLRCRIRAGEQISRLFDSPQN